MSTEAVDHEARARIAEVATVLWGDDRTRDNGIRSEVRAHEVEITNLREGLQILKGEMIRYKDTLPEHCLGLKALAEHEEACEELYTEPMEDEEAPEVKVAGIQAQSAKWKEILTLAAVLIVAIGQIVTATQANKTQLEITKLTYSLSQGVQK